MDQKSPLAVTDPPTPGSTGLSVVAVPSGCTVEDPPVEAVEVRRAAWATTSSLTREMVALEAASPTT